MYDDPDRAGTWAMEPMPAPVYPWPTEADLAAMDPPAHLLVLQAGEPRAVVLRDGQVVRRPGLTPEEASGLDEWLATPGERVSAPRPRRRHLALVFALAVLAPSVPNGGGATGTAHAHAGAQPPLAHVPATEADHALPEWDGPPQRPAELQPLITAAHQWLGREHGMASTIGRPRVYSIERWPFRELAGTLAVYAGAAVDLNTCRLSYSHHHAAPAIALLAARRSRVRVSFPPAVTVIHELLHCHDPRAPEGLVDAVAADLAPAFMGHLLGRRISTPDPARLVQYPGALGVFQRTGRAVGAGYRDPAAAELRRRLLATWSARNPAR